MRRQAATFLLEASEPDRASVLKQFDTGDLALDRDVLHWLQLAHETLIIPPATVARLRALYEQAPAETDDVVKISFGAGWAASRRAMEQRRANAPLNKRELIAPLVRLAPQTYVPVVLRSKDPAEIGYAYGHVEFASADDLIEGLASANETMRERLDDALARLIKSTLTVAERKALTQEVLSSKKRAGLSRISLAAYTLGTAAESQRDFASAQKLYALASANPDFGSAARAQRVGLLMKQQKTAEAKALAQGLMTALRDSHDGFTVLENDSLIDNSGLTTLIMKFDRASGN